MSPQVGVYEEPEEEEGRDLKILWEDAHRGGRNNVVFSLNESNIPDFSHGSVMEFSIDEAAVNVDDAFEDEDFDDNDFDPAEAQRLLSLV